MSILIYHDEGVSTDCVNALLDYYGLNQSHCVTGADLQNSEWINDAITLIIPGGRSLPFYKKIGATGNALIKKFVEQGGCYVGICAGAYYACKETIFAKNTPLELILPGELNFFSGNAVGPVFTDKAFVYESESGAQDVDIVLNNGEICSVYFNGGCYFEGTQNSKATEVIATYQKNNFPAIIACQVGKGRAVLLGVHPELSKDKSLMRFISA